MDGMEVIQQTIFKWHTRLTKTWTEERGDNLHSLLRIFPVIIRFPSTILLPIRFHQLQFIHSFAKCV